ncbi:MAG: VOC family protein [Alphaproteobacteria bacterium]|jgi:catechol 2,3-dioxygenase-like lactoylglutathione lyase family enzyme|nr:VOC family protein [Alphaproteobacteria bacterium]
MAPRLTHLALHVMDLEACVAFYRQFCGLEIVHDRGEGADGRVVWLAEPGREREFVFVLIAGGPGRQRAARDFSHFGFAMPSREAVDRVAAMAEAAGCLAWPPRDEAYPVGYYCGLGDPDGNVVEFSFGQPLGTGATGARAGPD